MQRSTRKSFAGYGIAVLAVAAAVFLRWLLDPILGNNVPLITLYGAVAIATWRGGYGPALVAAAFGYLAANYLFIEPRGTLALNGLGDGATLILYFATCFIIMGFGDGMRAALHRAEANAAAAHAKQKELEHEVEQRQRAEEALRDADHHKDDFLAALAHELRNPLAPIRNALQILHLQGPPSSNLQWARDVIDRQLQHMTRLIDDLLDVSGITRDKLDLRKERVELAKIVQGAVETSRPLVEACGHELFVTIPPEPVYVDADLTRLSQVFSNLINNAAKYTERGGQIRVSAKRQGSDVVVSVCDTGMGIPAEMLSRVFDMFTQLDKSREQSRGGLGIGLTLVKRLVEMHGGRVEAHSDGPGKGSEFIVRLPALIVPVESARRTIAGADQTPLPSSLRILVVDDDDDSAKCLSVMLGLSGNEVRTAHDGLAAVEAAADFRPDVVLLDIGLPKLDGYAAARRIRNQPGGKDMTLIALTGWSQDEDRRRSREAGFDHHMVKPVEPDSLIKLLATLGKEGVTV